jgi:hypothetical protein
LTGVSSIEVPVIAEKKYAAAYRVDENDSSPRWIEG